MNSEDHLPLPINIPNDNYPNCHDYTPLYLNNDAPIHSNEGYEKTATNNSPKKSSHVKFHDIICTIYIPCKDDFITCGVYDHLWWKPKDFKQFKIDALTEICLTMKEMNFNHAKDAIQYLYQPNEYPQANNFVEQSTLSLTASTTCSLNSNSPNMIIYSS